MMHRVVDCFEEWAGPIERVEEINCHHNYTVREKHFGKDVAVTQRRHRRSSGRSGGLIPGSMGAKSYVVTAA